MFLRIIMERPRLFNEKIGSCADDLHVAGLSLKTEPAARASGTTVARQCHCAMKMLDGKRGLLLLTEPINEPS
jgi:hypothetical protein